jgi:hypothetical protein
MIETTMTGPDSLLTDATSMVFYILRDESVAIAKRPDDLPYHKRRETYLSAGRFSPEMKKVIFYPDPVNPGRAIQLLQDNMHIDDTYSVQIQGGAVTAKVDESKGPFKHLGGVRKRAAEVLVEKGLRVQRDGSKSSLG